MQVNREKRRIGGGRRTGSEEGDGEDGERRMIKQRGGRMEKNETEREKENGKDWEKGRKEGK